MQKTNSPQSLTIKHMRWSSHFKTDCTQLL